jgi:hypothetical protein
MLPIPQNDVKRFNKALLQNAVPEPFHDHYRKWLRYFLDFCQKYPPPEAESEQIRLFIEKLKSKKQTPQQCTQATHAVTLYFESQKWKNAHHSSPVDTKIPKSDSHAYPPQAVSSLHEKDLADGYSGVFLKDSLEKKYPYDSNNAGPC